jgi:thiol:disulfide interchange protein DsbD
MLAFSAVFAAPFFILALFPALLKSLPQSGGWLNAVKVVMGFVETAAAIKFLSNADLVMEWGVFTREVFLAIWIAIAVITTVYLLGRFQLPHDTPVERVGAPRVLLASAFLAVGFWLLTGLFGGRLGEIDALIPPQEYPGKGNTSILASLSSSLSAQPAATTATATGAAPGSTGQAHEANGGWTKDDYAAAVTMARKSGKPIFIDFTGYTCTNCRWMEINMFSRGDVSSLMQKYVLLRLYTDRRDSINEWNRNLESSRYNTIELPYYAIITPDGKTISARGWTRNPDEFMGFLKKGIDANKQDLAER